MKIRDVELRTVCGYTSILPETEEINIAFAGKSNVGKSSLINAIMNRKKLARVGETPGKTRTINFYWVDALCGDKDENKSFYLVDLPGYGYANVPETEKAKWGRMVENYLYSSKKLRLVFLLVDIRHEPGKNDCQMYEWIRHSGCRTVIIATKSDKLKRSQLAKQLRLIRQGLGAGSDTPVIPFSALSKAGVEEIRGQIEEHLD